MDAPGVLGAVNAMLQRYEEIRKENERLQNQIKESEVLRNRITCLKQENQSLRQVIEFGRQSLDKNERRNDKVRQLSGVTDGTDPSDPQKGGSGQEEQQPEQQSQEVPENHQVPSSPAQSPLEPVALATNITTDGTLMMDETAALPSRVQGSVKATFSDWHTKHPTQTRCNLRSAHKCVWTSNREIEAFWVEGGEQKLVCKSCFNARRACVVPTDDGTFLVLPLPPSLRAVDAVAGDDGYYIASDDTPRCNAGQGPWSTKPARKRDRGEHGGQGLV